MLETNVRLHLFFLNDEKLQQKIQIYKICTKYSFRSLKTWGNEILTE